MKPFQTVQTTNSELQRIQDNIKSALVPLLARPIVDGHLIDEVFLVSGQGNLVAHKLGRKPRMVLVARLDTDARVWENVDAVTEKFLTMHCSASCTVSLWVA